MGYDATGCDMLRCDALWCDAMRCVALRCDSDAMRMQFDANGDTIYLGFFRWSIDVPKGIVLWMYKVFVVSYG